MVTMAEIILAASTCRRNTISDNNPTFGLRLCKNDSSSHMPPPYFQDLSVLIGLAFTAILGQNNYVDHCRPAFDLFLDKRHVIITHLEEPSVTAITQILEKGFSAFKFLGFPYYFDDFLQIYRHFLNTSNSYLPIHQKMRHILHQNSWFFND